MSWREAFSALLRPFGRGAIGQWLEFAVRRRLARPRAKALSSRSTKSLPCPLTNLILIPTKGRPPRISSTIRASCLSALGGRGGSLSLPSSGTASLALDSTVEALSGLFIDTRPEAVLLELLWSFVYLFHCKSDRIGRDLDDNETEQPGSHPDLDGCKIRSVKLERLIAQGLTLTERRNAFEFFRDYLADRYATETASSWRPRSGSQVNHRALTSAMIDSRDFLNARNWPRYTCSYPTVLG